MRPENLSLGSIECAFPRKASLHLKGFGGLERQLGLNIKFSQKAKESGLDGTKKEMNLVPLSKS
jgi:hypothetical protein